MKGMKPELAFKDSIPDGNYSLSDYTALDIVSGGYHVYGFIMWPDGRFEKDRPIAIISHGFPGTSSNDDIAYALCRTGFVVIRQFFRGAWGSEGEYLVTNCIEDVVNIVKYARSEEFTAKFKTDPESIVLIGHSMGGCISVNAAKEFEDIKALILMAPFEPYLSQETLGEAFMGNLMAEGYTLKCSSIQDVHDNLINNGEHLTFTREHEKLKDTHILLLNAEKDSVVYYPKTLKPFYDAVSSQNTDKKRQVKHYYAEHGLMGCRTNIISDIVDFLGSID